MKRTPLAAMLTLLAAAAVAVALAGCGGKGSTTSSTSSTTTSTSGAHKPPSKAPGYWRRRSRLAPGY